MCQSDRDNSAASPTAETTRLLSAIASLLDVPLSVFTGAAGEAEEGAAAWPTEPGELLKLYLDLPPEPRRELLAYARRLARGRS